MEKELKNMQDLLASRALEMEKARLEAHQQAMEELEKARVTETERQNSAKEEKKKIRERAEKAMREAQEAELNRQKALEEEKRSIEQEENRKQESVGRLVRMKEDIQKRLDEMEHAEELAKKQLRDAILMAANKATEEKELSEISVEYPVSPVNCKNPGDAVEGTDGSVPLSTELSFHMKQILRQANRQ